jgi:hypothetical protein
MLVHDGLALPDADGLDEHDVEAGGLAHEDRLAGPARDAAERAGARAGADEGVGRRCRGGHARLVAEDRCRR